MIRPWWWLVMGGMFAVTYSVRLLPFLQKDATRLPGLVRRILAVVPAAALGALIFPDLWYAVPATPGASVFGVPALLGSAAVAVAAVVTVRGGGLIVSVVAAIALTWAGVFLWL